MLFFQHTLDLFEAIDSRDVAAVSAALKHDDIDLEATNEFDETPLHIAVEKESLPIVKLLLEKGANTAAVSQTGETPLHVAAGDGTLSIVEALLMKNADVNVRDKFKRTPLHIAAANEELEVVKLLLNNGADWEAQERDQRTPLELARAYGRHSTVKFMETLPELIEKYKVVYGELLANSYLGWLPDEMFFETLALDGESMGICPFLYHYSQAFYEKLQEKQGEIEESFSKLTVSNG